MINMYLRNILSNTVGYVDAINVTPDGKAIARINDKWFFADDLVAA